MQVTAYANLTSQKLTSSAAGTSVLTLPTFVQGDSLRVGLRFVETIDGVVTEVSKELVGIKASIGFLDTPPTAGQFRLRKGQAPYVTGVNQTEALPYDIPSTALSAALSSIGLNGVTVELVQGSWIVSHSQQQIDNFHGVSLSGSQALYPASVVKVRERENGADFTYDIRLLQVPLASTSSFTPIVPPPPQVTRVQAGGSSGDTTWPEIQALTLPPAFRGVYQLRRNYKRTGELSLEDGPEQIATALAALAEDGESFVVSNPTTNVAHITFAGTMGGLPQDLLEVVVFSAPEGDPTFILDLDTDEMASALRATESIKPVFEVRAVIRDDNDPEVEHTYTLLRTEVTVTRELNWAGLEVAAGVDWLRPPYGISYIPFTLDQVIHGTRNYVTPFGDAVAKTFEITHGLDSLDYLPPAIIDNSNGALLVQGVDYEVIAATSNTITIQTLSQDAWPVNGLKLVLGLVGPSAAFQVHSHTIAQIEALQTILDDFGARLLGLEDLLPSSAAKDDSTLSQEAVAEWSLPTMFEVYPTRAAITAKEVTSIAVADLPRAGGLLPAKYYTDTPLDVTALPGAPGDAVVYNNSGTASILLPGYLGRRSALIAPNAKFAFDGRGFYGVEKAITADDVYYPVDFTRELFRIAVNEKQLRLGKSLTLDLSLVVAVFKSNVSAQWGIIIDIGVPSAEGTTSANLFDLTYLPPSLDCTFLVSPVPSSHNFGLRISRKMVSAVDTLTVDRVAYGSLEATSTGDSLSVANFVIRGRLHRFDTQDNKPDPRGLIAFNGLKATLGSAEGLAFGKATIK